MNDEGELPNEIDGRKVIGTEDGFVITDNLVLHSDNYPVYEFDKFESEAFDKLFGVENAEWCNDETKRKIRDILNYDS